MDLNEAFSLMGAIRKAENNPRTAIGAAKALQKKLGKLVLIGAKDGAPALSL